MSRTRHIGYPGPIKKAANSDCNGRSPQSGQGEPYNARTCNQTVMSGSTDRTSEPLLRTDDRGERLSRVGPAFGPSTAAPACSALSPAVPRRGGLDLSLALINMQGVALGALGNDSAISRTEFLSLRRTVQTSCAA